MSYTFGGGTGNDIVYTTALALGADNTTCLVAGWWYPTTLTATRGYWSAGNIFGAEVDTTTSEIRLRTDNTTDGQWVTSGAGIVTGKWHFLAFLAATENTTVAGAWRVWVGTADTRPTRITPTVAVSRSGNYTGSTSFYLGNKGTSTLSFQGDIGWAFVGVASTVGVNSPFYIGTSGVISDTEAQLVEDRWITPLWMGRPDMNRIITQSLSNSFSFFQCGLDFPGALGYQVSQLTNPNSRIAPTINGATFSEAQPPVRIPPYTPHVRVLAR